MAQYNGKITLLNINDGDSSSAVGIQSTKIYYGASSDKNIKPTEWTEQTEGSQIPSVPEGSYLWTKTVFIYTDGKQTESYSYSYQGKNGEGVPALYELDVEQNEILKFVGKDEGVFLSPKILKAHVIYKDPKAPNGFTEVRDVDIQQLKFKIYNSNTGQWLEVNFLPEITTISPTGEISIDLEDLLKKDSNTGTPSQYLKDEESFFEVSYNHIVFDGDKENNFYLTNYVDFRYGMNKDMASLSLKSAGLVASIQNTALEFNSNGLTVNNGGFKITRKNQTPSLSADTNGNLTIVGDIYAERGIFSGELKGATGQFTGELKGATGTFAGDISAATGTFKGGIYADSGAVGGFTIEKGKLYSIAKDKEGASMIILDGQNGEVKAQNITLGTGAKIEKYLQIGPNVKLSQAYTDSDAFLTVLKDGKDCLRFGADGILSIGNDTLDNKIIIDGPHGFISSSNFGKALGWKISNTDSVFNEVTVRGSIKASVFEYGNVQAVGGTLLIRPSSRIKKIEEINTETTIEQYIVTLENAIGFEKDDYCSIEEGTAGSTKKVYLKIVAKEGNNVTLEGNLTEEAAGKPIINFGKNGSVGIGINASAQDFFIPPEAISVFDFQTMKDGTNSIVPHVILGKLPNEDSYGYAKNTYGLYAENVLLKGSLVTQSEITHDNPTYSGISTLHQGVGAPTSDKYGEYFIDINGQKNTGEILIWAGAKGTSKAQIEDSKFFVDRNGNLFAGSGYFKGTIITDAKITASELETATITGSNKELNQPALTIKDTTKGILFTNKKQDGQNYEEIFKVTDNLFGVNTTSIVLNKNFVINQNGSGFASNFYLIPDQQLEQTVAESGQKVILLSNNRISAMEDFKKNEESGLVKSYINFEEGIQLSADGENDSITINSAQTKINNLLKITKSIRYGDSMEYKPVYHLNSEGVNSLIGYDLFID